MWSDTMRNHEIIRNEFDGVLAQSNRFEKKYLRFIEDFSRKDKVADDVFEALKSKDIEKIETVLAVLVEGFRARLLLIGLVCLIIDRESLYRKAGYHSYLEYSRRLFEKLEISNQTLSDAKIIMGAYIDHYKGLSAHGFRLERNAHKLKYIDEAVLNHGDREEVYSRAANATFLEFVKWAKNAGNELPPPEPPVNIRIEGDKILVDGKNILNFPVETPEKVKEWTIQDLQKTFAIRKNGEEPIIFEPQHKGDARAVENFLKERWSKF
jgi:hypothetical protein